MLVRVDVDPPAFALHTPAQGDASTVVYFHGNGSQLSDDEPFAAAIRAAGLGLLMVEYPGYGPAADQQASEASVFRAAASVLDHLRDTSGVDQAHTVLLGHSLGTAVAAEMAVRGYGSRLVLSAPFTSTRAMIQQGGRYLPSRLLAAADPMDTLSKASRLTVPTIVIHGGGDETVPPAMSAELAARLPHAYRLVLPGHGHNDMGDAIARAAVIAATEPADPWPELMGAAPDRPVG